MKQSADARFENGANIRFNGAFTYYLLRELNRQPEAPLITLCSSIVGDLRKNSYSQTPGVKGSAEITARPLLGGPVKQGSMQMARSFFRIRYSSTVDESSVEPSEDASLEDPGHRPRRATALANASRGVGTMNEGNAPQALRVVLATNGDLRRKAQKAAFQAWYEVIKEAGYSITPSDIDEMKSDLTATAISLSDSAGNVPRDDLGSVIVAAGVGAAIAAGGF